MSTLLLALAAFVLAAGAVLVAWPAPAPAPAPAQDDGPAPGPATYRRRIAGALLVGIALFLGGFTLAVRHPIF